MATAHHEIHIQAPASRVWDLIKEFHPAPARMAPGFVTDSTPEGADIRVVTFANGAVARERFISVDDDLRRTVFSIVGGTATPEHDNSSMQVFDDGDGCRFVWIHDVLPDELAPRLSAAMQHALPILKHTAENATS